MNQLSEIWTIDDVAALLKMTRGQVYTLCRTRSQVRMIHPLPVLKINGNLRFRRDDIEKWLAKLAQAEAA